MPFELPTQKELRVVYRRGEKTTIALFETLIRVIRSLEYRVQTLEDQVAKNTQTTGESSSKDRPQPSFEAGLQTDISKAKGQQTDDPVETFYRQRLHLNERETAVLNLVSQGFTNDEISRRMNLSKKTIEKVLSNEDTSRSLFRKIGVDNRVRAAMWFQGITSVESVLMVAGEHYESIRAARRRGDLQLVIEKATRLADQLKEIGEKNPTEFVKDVWRLRGEVLYELAMAYTDMSWPHEIIKQIEPITRELEYISKVSRSKEFLGLAYYLWAEAYYIKKQWGTSMECVNRALNIVINPDTRLSLLRLLVLDSACLGERNEWAQQEARRLIEGGQFSELAYACSTSEGMARAQRILNITRGAEKNLEETERIYATIKKENQRVPVVEAQLARTKLELISLTPRYKSSLESMGLKTIELTEEHGYQRITEQVRALLNASLN